MVVDWHNFGYTILALSLPRRPAWWPCGREHPLVSVSRVYERTLAGWADDHLCVTAAMATWMHANWGVR